MVEAASTPTLASLIKTGIERGLIRVIPDYVMSHRKGK
jgi:hypothetical protein